MATHARLLRVLETGEYLRVGSSKVRKTDVRVVAATNLDFDKAMAAGKFREDLFYRLNQVPLLLHALRERGDDIHLLFRKFTADFSDRHHMLADPARAEAVELLVRYPWPGNVRQLEEHRRADQRHRDGADRGCGPAARLPAGTAAPVSTTLPVDDADAGPGMNEREILYKLLFEMKSDLTDLKSLVLKMIQDGRIDAASSEDHALVNRVFGEQGGTEVLRLPERAGRLSAGRALGGWSTPAESRRVRRGPGGGRDPSLVESERESIRRAWPSTATAGSRRQPNSAFPSGRCTAKSKEFGLK